MAHKEIKDCDAAMLYDYVCSVCGKGGYEMTRTSGSSGEVSPSTDANFLIAMTDHFSFLPRATGACKIFRGKLNYVIAYQRVAKNDGGSNGIAFFKYGVPREGGSFQCTTVAVRRFPIFGEMAYGKMIATLLLEKWNSERVSVGKLPFASGAVSAEL